MNSPLLDRGVGVPINRVGSSGSSQRELDAGAPRNHRKVVTRENIMRAAIVHFSERGYDLASIHSIAEDANVAQGTVFWHFGNKLALYIEVARWAGNLFHETMRPEVDCEGPPPTVKQLAVKQLELLRRNPHIGRLSLAIIAEATGPHPELRPAMDFFNRRVTEVWRHWALRCADTGRLRPGFDPDAVGGLVATMLAGLNVGSLIHPDEATRSFDTIMSILESGCLSPILDDSLVRTLDASRALRPVAAC